jgi:hypothetical protein
LDSNFFEFVFFGDSFFFKGNEAFFDSVKLEKNFFFSSLDDLEIFLHFEQFKNVFDVFVFDVDVLSALGDEGFVFLDLTSDVSQKLGSSELIVFGGDTSLES